MGRPTKPVETLKNQVIRIRVTEEQRRELAEAAERDGCDVSSWLRSLGMREARRTASDRTAGEGEPAARVPTTET